MDDHQNARLTIYSREQMARYVVLERCTLQGAATRFQVSAKTAAKWVQRYREGGAAAMSDRSSRPRRCYRSTAAAIDPPPLLSIHRIHLNRKGVVSSPVALELLEDRPRVEAQPRHGQPHPAPQRHEPAALARSTAPGGALRTPPSGRSDPLRY